MVIMILMDSDVRRCKDKDTCNSDSLQVVLTQSHLLLMAMTMALFGPHGKPAGIP